MTGRAVRDGGMEGVTVRERNKGMDRLGRRGEKEVEKSCRHLQPHRRYKPRSNYENASTLSEWRVNKYVPVIVIKFEKVRTDPT